MKFSSSLRVFVCVFLKRYNYQRRARLEDVLAKSQFSSGLLTPPASSNSSSPVSYLFNRDQKFASSGYFESRQLDSSLAQQGSMPHSSSVVRLRTASILALQAGIMGQRQLQPVLLGKSPMGTRYYFELVPKGMSLAVSNMDDREVDGFHCYYTKPYVKASKQSKKYDARLYTVDDTIGFKDFQASGKIADETCFETFTPLSGVDKGVRPLFPTHPIVITANRLCAENELMITKAEEEPAPNGVYYGFIGDELEATIKFDEESQIQHVEVNARQKWRHNVLTFKMIGKAINCVFTKEGSSEEVGLIVEPVDPNIFNGTRESFALARLNTIVGQTFDRSDLRDLLGLTKKFKAVASRVRKGIRGIRELRLMPSRRSRDELRIRLLTEADTEADDYSDRHD